jgi:apolipoprotein D and lipocalin family protein
MGHLVGRWYEIARVPNLAETSCPFAASDWQPQPNGRFQVTQSCSRTEGGPITRTIKGTAEPLDPASHAKWRMSYFGGLIHREYWFMDHAADDEWLILAMPGKPYVWILSRRPQLPEAARQQALQRIAAMGYDVKRLVLAGRVEAPA